MSGREIPVLLAWSGGKDSAMALQALRESTVWDVRGLLTTVSERFDRIIMHGVRRALLEEQAAALRLPLTVVMLPADPTNRDYDTRMAEALESFRARGVRHVAFGDLFLQEVREYREAALARIDMEAVFPLWGKSTQTLAEQFIDAGFRAVLTCVDTTQADASLAGREFDRVLLSELPAGVDPCGENGEFHTFVYAGPILSRDLALRPGKRVLRDNRFMYRDLLLRRLPG